MTAWISRGPRLARLVAPVGLCCALLGTSVLGPAALGGPGMAVGAALPASQATGTFLGGTVGGQDLSTVAAIQGESAQSTGGKDVARWNSLNASLLSGAVTLPLTHALQLPGGNVFTLGAVEQYAQARADGSAHGASGAVSNSGAISVGGQDGAPPADATVDLAGAGGAQLARTLGDVKLTTGALAGRADQAAGVGGAQQGSYRIGGLTLELTAPALAALVNPLISQGTTTVAGLATSFNGLGLPVTVTGIQNFPKLAETLSSTDADNGAITANLQTGSIRIDLAALLAASGLDLNNLPPNTHLGPYLARALSTALPAAISSLLVQQQAALTTAFGEVGLSAGGVALNGAALAKATGILNGLQARLNSALAAGAAQLGSAVFAPLAAASEQLLDPVVNVQSNAGGTFTERALQLRLGDSAVVLNLASASVGPGALPSAPAAASAANPASTAPRAQGVSPIKIDAGRATVRTNGQPWALTGLALLLIGTAGLIGRRTWRPRRG